jgi:hypothetical protein
MKALKSMNAPTKKIQSKALVIARAKEKES